MADTHLQRRRGRAMTTCQACQHPACEHGDTGCAHPMPDWAVCDCTREEPAR